MIVVDQEDEVEHERQVRRLEQRLRRLDITGTPGTLVAGNLEQGYSVDTGRQDGSIGGGGGGPPTAIGACCHVDGYCDIQTESDCTFIGGTYQGDWTDCDPNPCPPATGACCFLDGSCLDGLSSGDCASDGGTYQGDGSVCADDSCGGSPPGCSGCECSGNECCIIETFFGGHCTWGEYSPTSTACCIETSIAIGGADFMILGVGGCDTFYGACCDVPGAGCVDSQTEQSCICREGTFQGVGTLCSDGCP